MYEVETQNVIILSDGNSLFVTTTFDEIFGYIGEGYHLATKEEIINLVDSEPEILN